MHITYTMCLHTLSIPSIDACFYYCRYMLSLLFILSLIKVYKASRVLSHKANLRLSGYVFDTVLIVIPCLSMSTLETYLFFDPQLDTNSNLFYGLKVNYHTARLFMYYFTWKRTIATGPQGRSNTSDIDSKVWAEKNKLQSRMQSRQSGIYAHEDLPHGDKFHRRSSFASESSALASFANFGAGHGGQYRRKSQTKFIVEEGEEISMKVNPGLQKAERFARPKSDFTHKNAHKSMNNTAVESIGPTSPRAAPVLELTKGEDGRYCKQGSTAISEESEKQCGFSLEKPCSHASLVLRTPLKRTISLGSQIGATKPSIPRISKEHKRLMFKNRLESLKYRKISGDHKSATTVLPVSSRSVDISSVCNSDTSARLSHTTVVHDTQIRSPTNNLNQDSPVVSLMVSKEGSDIRHATGSSMESKDSENISKPRKPKTSVKVHFM
eukprot:1342952-Amorphochlora_amoeboformis.AAC.1